MRPSRWTFSLLLAVPLFAGQLAQPACADDPSKGPDAKELQEVLDKAYKYLREHQADNGSFSATFAGPGISALVVAGALRNGVAADDALVAKTLGFISKNVKDDGGIYDKGMANYTTSVALMAVVDANKGGKYDAIVKNASTFLKNLQNNGDKGSVEFGGLGYDKEKRKPDASNTEFFIEALLAADVSKDDPAIKNALEFIGKCQNLPGETNPQPFAKKTTDEDKGGITYTPLEEDNHYKTTEGGLRSLGAMTYGGLKSFLYAGVSKDDPRVKGAINWIRAHYTLEENPGLKKAGLFYYYHTFAKAMDALGEDPFVDKAGTKHDWRKELFDSLKKQQQADGSWVNKGDRQFGESDPNLATAFAILALSYCHPKK
jgi:squalene-hopene/tetraprenyl-beta-curcumene cyclase